ncbi:hypothetical protein [Falsiroseomonas selenitidurans]|uniref:Uncharacterized protein n=1 Tax=Falsiroseomonas selenitidurans TaxID=2716335 RepID=A0ABX1E688_9PROT|nr:hypothetical protein [Falsiroseomonas selenitidurans]NKC32481.1 hypothetical protein [Falsiroseomonas selenitidurans]
MIGELVAWLVLTFLVGPMQADLRDRLLAAQAPPAVLAQLAVCASGAAPALVQRAGEDPWWGVTTAIRAWIGTLPPEDVLADATPGCGPAVAAARPFLRRG